MTPAQLLIITLARACIGEAGWDAHETGECAAITFVHLSRSDSTAQGRTRTAIKYSSALTGKRTWIRGLTLDGNRPKTFPNLRWGPHKRHLLETIKVVRGILNGRVKNPCPGATIYGSQQDWKAKTWKGYEQVCGDKGWGNLFGRKIGKKEK